MSRRQALGLAAGAAAACATTGSAWATRLARTPAPLFRISLAQWSLHRTIRAGRLDHLDFAPEARRLGFDAIEYVSSFFQNRARDQKYLDAMSVRARDAEVEQLLIMVDGAGALGDADPSRRAAAVGNHRPWLDAASRLGCHSIRVNAQSSGTPDEQRSRAAEGLRSLCELADPLGLHVIVENHGGLSSNARWLASVIREADHPLCGTLPDFGNFCMDWSRADDPDAWYDRYKGVAELMPFARAVSAKSHEFDNRGDEVRTDYRRMLRIVLDAGYRGWIGVEYEGSAHTEHEGIRLTRNLLESVRNELEEHKQPPPTTPDPSGA